MNCSHFATYIFFWSEVASVDIPGPGGGGYFLIGS